MDLMLHWRNQLFEMVNDLLHDTVRDTYKIQGSKNVFPQKRAFPLGEASERVEAWMLTG